MRRNIGGGSKESQPPTPALGKWQADKALGMGRDVTRRDFLDATLLSRRTAQEAVTGSGIGWVRLFRPETEARWLRARKVSRGVEHFALHDSPSADRSFFLRSTRLSHDSANWGVAVLAVHIPDDAEQYSR